MLLTQIAHLALIKTALIIFGSFRAGVIWKNLYLALINSRNHFSRVKYLSKTLTVVYAQEIPYYTHITTQVFNAGKMIE